METVTAIGGWLLGQWAGIGIGAGGMWAIPKGWRWLSERRKAVAKRLSS